MTRNPRRWARPVSGGVGGIRLVSAITFLALVGMLVYRTRDPQMWRWVAPDDDSPAVAAGPPAPANPPAAPPTTAAPPAAPALTPAQADEEAAVGTDRDPEEADALREELQAVSDRTLLNRKEEMEAYYRILRWVDKQPFAALNARAEKVRYNDFVVTPDRYRGKLVHLRLHIRRILPCEKTSRRPNPPYEVWGFTTDSQAWLYCVVVPELPPGMPVGEQVMETADLAGYFFKLQGYYPATSRPNESPLFAPLILGRLEWVKPAPIQMQSTDWKLIIGGVGALVLVGVVSVAWAFFASRARGGARVIRSGPRALGNGPLDWFDPAEPDTTAAGNILDVSPDVDHSEPGPVRPQDGNGHPHADPSEGERHG